MEGVPLEESLKNPTIQSINTLKNKLVDHLTGSGVSRKKKRETKMSEHCECFKSELDLFELPAKQQMIQKGFIHEISPIAAPAKGSDVVEFDIISSDDTYIDPSYIYYSIQGKILSSNDTANADTVCIAPVNNFAQS